MGTTSTFSIAYGPPYPFGVLYPDSRLNLQVYEGLTQYLGYVLATRAGFISFTQVGGVCILLQPTYKVENLTIRWCFSVWSNLPWT